MAQCHSFPPAPPAPLPPPFVPAAPDAPAPIVPPEPVPAVTPPVPPLGPDPAVMPTPPVEDPADIKAPPLEAPAPPPRAPAPEVPPTSSESPLLEDSLEPQARALEPRTNVSRTHLISRILASFSVLSTRRATSRNTGAERSRGPRRTCGRRTRRRPAALLGASTQPRLVHVATLLAPASPFLSHSLRLRSSSIR